METPLLWSIVVGSSRYDIQRVEDLRAKRVAVSRIGRLVLVKYIYKRLLIQA